MAPGRPPGFASGESGKQSASQGRPFLRKGEIGGATRLRIAVWQWLGPSWRLDSMNRFVRLRGLVERLRQREAAPSPAAPSPIFSRGTYLTTPVEVLAIPAFP